MKKFFVASLVRALGRQTHPSNQDQDLEQAYAYSRLMGLGS